MSGPRKVKLADKLVDFPSRDLQPLNDCTDLFLAKDWKGLRAALNDDGYLYIKGFFPAGSVGAAGGRVMDHLARMDTVLDPAFPPGSGILRERCGMGCLPFLEGKNELTQSPEVAGVIAGDALAGFMQQLLGEPIITLEYKWLRTMPRASFTGAHCDRVYMSRGSARLHTTWIPLQDTPMELGGLAVCQGSHRLPGFARLQETYGKLDVERDGLDGTGWFTTQPDDVSAFDADCQWRSGDFAAGDIVIFGMGLVHASTANLTDRVRMSCDVRWQPAADPVDDRYMRPNEPRAKAGAWAKDGSAVAGEAAPHRVTIEQLKERWGFSPAPAAVAPAS